MSHILHTVGARPNFMKAGPVIRAIAGRGGLRQTIVHTGQHYDAEMSEVFFRQLGIPEPDINLEVGSGSHARQTAEIMSRFEDVVLQDKPDLVLVYGDVNSTVGAALVCAKLLIPVGHVEAGLRSFDRTMPEEINRLLTDQIADLLFTPSSDADKNLLREGIAPEKIHFVGNVMIDSLVALLPTARQSTIQAELGLTEPYGLVTLHRPVNVDRTERLAEILQHLCVIAARLRLVFPVHPRTRQRLEEAAAGFACSDLSLTEPLGYLDFLALQEQAKMVITDSGGIQEESTYLGVPCLTLRENTERPVTVEVGTNVLVGHSREKLTSEVDKVLAGTTKRGAIPPLWDGHAAERIAQVIETW